jgi:hypothetical protein
MFRVLALLTALVPISTWSCEHTRQACKQRLASLVSVRAESIAATFDGMESAMPADIRVRFMSSRSSERARFGDETGYDPESQTLYLAYTLLGERVPRDLRDAIHYWSFYADETLRVTYPIVRTIDGALWNTYLQEAASRRGLTWPHADCRSPDSAKRLPCEMLRDATVEYTTRAHERLFNTNRVDVAWPEDYRSFAGGLWNNDNHEAARVRIYGGLLLVRPLIRKLGLPQALAYFAQTPFRIEQNNMRLSAMRYQQRALRTAL